MILEGGPTVRKGRSGGDRLRMELLGDVPIFIVEELRCNCGICKWCWGFSTTGDGRGTGNMQTIMANVWKSPMVA